MHSFRPPAACALADPSARAPCSSQAMARELRPSRASSRARARGRAKVTKAKGGKARPTQRPRR
eukprot:7206599-Pyramimonas_sp.AAC.1